ncbi:MAG: 4-hydroxythreonine-4-phosphate dehydrogenase PdxA [Bacteroidales bacterium]|nr:4-hydroxythreonine-4-phosphate dehydrogenase PdxA [Bacteroidales bacterium]
MTKANHEKREKIRVAITHGDFNGISYEIIINALNDNRLLDLFTPVIYGLPNVMGYHRKSMKIGDFNYQTIDNINDVNDQKINLLSIDESDVKIEFGQSKKVAGEFAYKALESAVADLKNGQVDVLVTAPINKSNIHSGDFHFLGHTEYLTERFGADNSLMLMVSGNLRVATVTNHLPIKEVADSLNEELIIKKLSILNESLKKDFLIDKPKIAVLGLNPHAGDDGLIGKEDKGVIHAAIMRAKENGMLVFGPFPADGFFGSEAYKKFDAVLGMYHDQAMVPFKLLASETGVNFTAGLPIVRTSPDHGTAYDIAGKFEASATSLREAIYLAMSVFRNREKWDEMNANPLTSKADDRFNKRHPADDGLEDLIG